jgi:hypothetical protein
MLSHTTRLFFARFCLPSGKADLTKCQALTAGSLPTVSSYLCTPLEPLGRQGMDWLLWPTLLRAASIARTSTAVPYFPTTETKRGQGYGRSPLGREINS